MDRFRVRHPPGKQNTAGAQNATGLVLANHARPLTTLGHETAHGTRARHELVELFARDAKLPGAPVQFDVIRRRHRSRCDSR